VQSTFQSNIAAAYQYDLLGRALQLGRDGTQSAVHCDPEVDDAVARLLRNMTNKLSSSMTRSRLLTVCWLIALCLLSTRIIHAQGCANAIACENALDGDDDWQIKDSGDDSIQGFATDMSVNVGGTIHFKINTSASNYTISIYRLGFYKGAGGRKITSFSPQVPAPQVQGPCMTITDSKLIDCGNWEESASWTVPSSSVSGVYLALLQTNTNKASHIYFVVRNDSSQSQVLYQTSDETWQAYNDYGGHSLYGGAGTWDLNDRAYKVSYNRPFHTRTFEAATFLFSGEYPLIRWMESNGFDVTYISDIDATRSGSLLLNHRLLVSAGHDEYMSSQRRTNIEAARDSGVNMAFFTGNEVFWKTRWENSIDGSNTPFRTLVCYKETYFGTLTTYMADPGDPPTWTGTWRDPRFSPPSDGNRPENSLTGTLFMVNGPGADNDNLSIQVPAADGKMRFWRNTSIANMSSGQVTTLPAGTLGYEWDGDIDNGARPPGVFSLSTSTYTLVTDLLLDYGGTYGGGVMTHHMSMYRAPSNALVFGAGTVQWAWGLDDEHDNGDDPADLRMQQATLNLFADMNVQPTTLQQGLVLANRSTDQTPPTVAITSPAAGSTASFGVSNTITGTAADVGGGVVGAVEVSIDGGQSWHPAVGRENWQYAWTPGQISSSATIMARAVDDSGNLQTSPVTRSVSLSGIPQCPCSVWGPSATPSTPSESDANAVEVGMKFRSDSAGFVTGIKFYKGPANGGTHIGNLWTLRGQKLASVTFTNETQTGWQQATFATPVAISANTTYIVSYYAPTGGYADNEQGFLGASIDAPPLHALASGVDGGNGLYAYGPSSTFPTNFLSSDNYWVDVVFSAGSSLGISGNAGVGGATVTLSGTSNATVTADSSGNYSFSNLISGNYTIKPSKIGTAFSPVSQSVNLGSTNVTGVNFSATSVPTYAISGTVTGATTVTVNLTGTDGATTTTNGSGAFSFGNLMNGSYTVTPTKPGFSFSPGSQSVTVNGANVTGVTFSATALPTYSISGTITGVPGARVSLNGPQNVNLSTTADASGNYTFQGLNNGSYNVTPSAANTTFAPPVQQVIVNNSNVSGVDFAPTQGLSIWTDSALPGSQSEADTSPVELGLKFRSDVAGFVTGVRFFKGTGNAGTHIGNLWNGAGQNIAKVTFTGETASGWQEADFPTPVLITPNTTYTISYFAPQGGYAADVNFFSNSGVDNGPLHALQSGVDGENGVFLYSTNSQFPFNGFNGTNYWVDVVFVSGSGFSIAGTVTNGAGTTLALSGGATGTATADSSGNYKFTGIANGNYTVTPSKSGFTFSPANQPVTVNGANVTAINFTATSTANFSISGTIANGGGATVTLSGTSSATVTANASGVYTFPNLANGNYTVTPSKSGFTFSPSSQAVAVNGANVTAINFTATSTATFSISGTITNGSGATVTLSGTSSATVTANASGAYTFPSLANGSYTVTPSKSGFTFSPVNRAVTVNGANVTAINFTGTSTATFSVTGTITNGSGATVTLSGTSSATVTANASGAYTFPNLANGNYTVTPSKSGFTFSPASQAVTVNGTNVTGINFTGTSTATFSVTGTLTNGSGATVTLSGTSSATVTANASGAYTFSGLANGSYTVTPSKTGFVFSPVNRAVTVSGANVTGINFTGSASGGTTFGISGTATNGSGATITLSGAGSATATANASGAYTFSNLANGSYTVTPSRTGFVFSPVNRAVTVNGANVTGINFTGTASGGTFSISGTITNGSAATVTLSGAASSTTTANASGAFTFSNLGNGSYTVTPSKSGMTFTPANRAVTISGANVTAVNFTANVMGTPLSLWSTSIVPATKAQSDSGAVEVGLKFRSDVAGSVVGLRFYKGSGNTGTHVGHLWASSGGSPLATVTFTGETSTGWQQATFSAPVAISPNTTYIISYYAPKGHYAANTLYFASAGFDNAPLHALAEGVDGSNGVYLYGTNGGFPISSFNSANYWVDVLFSPSSN
jgi:hypothetical protein